MVFTVREVFLLGLVFVLVAVFIISIREEQKIIRELKRERDNLLQSTKG